MFGQLDQINRFLSPDSKRSSGTVMVLGHVASERPHRPRLGRAELGARSLSRLRPADDETVAARLRLILDASKKAVARLQHLGRV